MKDRIAAIMIGLFVGALLVACTKDLSAAAAAQQPEVVIRHISSLPQGFGGFLYVYEFSPRPGTYCYMTSVAMSCVKD